MRPPDAPQPVPGQGRAAKIAGQANRAKPTAVRYQWAVRYRRDGWQWRQARYYGTEVRARAFLDLLWSSPPTRHGVIVEAFLERRHVGPWERHEPPEADW